MSLSPFTKALAGPNLVDRLRAGLIGEGAPVPGPFGTKGLIYADFVASGRALRQVEDFVAGHVLPYYANTHTQASFCGAQMTRLREDARAAIARLCHADPADYAVIFAGAGATAGLNRLVSLFGVAAAADAGQQPVVFVGPYEHHSNLLPWRESGATVVEIGEAAMGGPDLDALETALLAHAGSGLKIGAFSAASNVTGVITDTDAVTQILKRHGALAVWDYAGGAPYLPIDMNPGPGLEKDAVVASPHKFPGGPGASGLLILRRAAVRNDKPSWPGGSTVSFVSPWDHVYLDDLTAREEAGTPNVIGDIRAGLAFLVKAQIGQDWINQREAVLNARALKLWRQNPRLELLGVDRAKRLPIFSFRVRDGEGGLVHHQLFTRMLSDVYGIQARGGCACAGPYAHRLLDIDEAHSKALATAIAAGQELEKPGWVRLNFSYLMSDETADKIIAAVDDLARRAPELARHYQADSSTARFAPILRSA
ncbi:MAG: aminotransferase class V-fold PLP-dependent enzyme [Sphingomonadales bacterium]